MITNENVNEVQAEKARPSGMESRTQEALAQIHSIQSEKERPPFGLTATQRAQWRSKSAKSGATMPRKAKRRESSPLKETTSYSKTAPTPPNSRSTNSACGPTGNSQFPKKIWKFIRHSRPFVVLTRRWNGASGSTRSQGLSWILTWGRVPHSSLLRTWGCRRSGWTSTRRTARSPPRGCRRRNTRNRLLTTMQGVDTKQGPTSPTECTGGPSIRSFHLAANPQKH